MSATKPTQPNKQKVTDHSTTVPSSGRIQATQTTVRPATALSARPHNAQGGLLAVPKQSQLDKLVLANAVKFDKGDLYIAVHRAVKSGINEDVRFSFYSCEKDKEMGMRWAVKGNKLSMSICHAPMLPQEVLDLSGTASFKLCFAIVIKQNISSEVRQSSSSPAALGKAIPISDWERVAQVITQDDEKEGRFLPVVSSLDYVRVTVKRLEKAGFVKFRDELRFGEEIESVEEIFAYGNVGPLPDRILVSRHILYC